MLLFERMVGYQHGVLLGLQRYVQARRLPWVYVGTDPVPSNVRDIIAQLPIDGVVALIFRREMMEAVRAIGCPAVDTGNAIAGCSIPKVGVDEQAIARLAAEHLIDRGLRHFAFLGFPGEAYSDERQAAFVAAVRAAGFECDVLDYRRYRSAETTPAEPWIELPTWAGGNKLLKRWAGDLPKPCGVFAANDERALRLLDSATQAGVRVPEQLAIVGVDNDELLCPYARPPLTSIALPTERIGFEAAALLDRLMAGGPPPAGSVLLPPVGVMARASSDVLALDDPDLVAAVRWLRANAVRPIRVSDVLQQVPMSRRSLEQKFVAVLGRTPHDEIRRVRLERARDLLANTDLPISGVAKRSGVANAERLAELFRAALGTTPTSYRRTFQSRH